MIAQTVIFQLKSPDLREQFLALTGQMAAWLHQQPGFVSYDLVEGIDGWSDRLVWQTREDEAQGRDAFFQTDIAANMLQCVAADFRSVTGELSAFGK